MGEPFNQLTPEEDELLSVLAEECAAVIQIVMKIQRHGLASHHPDNPGIQNSVLLHKEIGDVLAAIELLTRIDLIAPNHLEVHKNGKLFRIGRYLHHHKTQESQEWDKGSEVKTT